MKACQLFPFANSKADAIPHHAHMSVCTILVTPSQASYPPLRSRYGDAQSMSSYSLFKVLDAVGDSFRGVRLLGVSVEAKGPEQLPVTLSWLYRGHDGSLNNRRS